MTAAGWVTSRPIGAVRGAVAAGCRGRHSLARLAERTPARTDQAALCWDGPGPGSGGAVVVADQSAQADAAGDAAGRPVGGRVGLDQRAAEALVVSLGVVVGDELAQGAPQVRLSERDELAEALVAHGPHEALRVGVEVSRNSWEVPDPG